jgi:putative tricarboxylic transport membrane protein
VLIVGLLTITVMYIIAMDILGFVISTSIYLFAMLLFLGMRRYAVMILTSILTTAVIFVIFRTVMYIGLPAGIFDPTQLLYKLLNY